MVEISTRRIPSLFKHVAGVDNNAADALSRLEMVHKMSNTANWEPPSKRLIYINDNEMKHFCKSLVEMNMNSSPNEEISNAITALDAAEFIDARFDHCKFALDVRMFKKHQQENDVLQDTIKNKLKRHPETTIYNKRS